MKLTLLLIAAVFAAILVALLLILIALFEILVVFVLISFILVLINPLRTVESATDLAYKSVESDLNFVASVKESVCCFNRFVFRQRQ